MRRPFLAALLLVACGKSPDPVPVAKTAPPPAPPAEPAAPAPAPPADTSPPREPPLTQEEIDLINADPNQLTPEQRRARAFALRRKIMQNPDSPQAQQLEKLRKAVEAGEIVPQLPDRGHEPSPAGLVLSAPERKTEPAPTPAASPEKAP